MLIASDKKNHKAGETWMLAQRIGPLDVSKVAGLPATRGIGERAPIDGQNRVLINYFEETSDGRLYKGEWYFKFLS